VPARDQRSAKVIANALRAGFHLMVHRPLPCPWAPKARIRGDHYHLVKFANDMFAAVSRRVSWDR
jgi:hypothetical protein